MSYFVRKSLKKKKTPDDKNEKFEELKVNEMAPIQEQLILEPFEEEKVANHNLN